MEEQISIIPVDPITFELQDYSVQDNEIIATFEVNTVFSQFTDYIEYFIFDENEKLIFPQSGTRELLTYTVKNGEVLLSPDEDLARLGFDDGLYYITYNFYRKRLASSISSNYFITNISSDRTEIRLDSNTISDADIISSTNEFIQYRNQSDYFVDFYLNFGSNKLIIANNVRLDSSANNPTILIKLYEPLPSEFILKSQVWVVEQMSDPQSYQVTFPFTVSPPRDFKYLSGPNFNLNIKEKVGSTSQEFSLNNLLSSNVTSSYNQLQSLLNEKGLKINVNYEDFNEFIHFSSAKTRLENFYYKVSLIERYNNLAQELIDANSNTSAVTASIQNIIKNFDNYEYFLYYNSGSQYSWPKSNTEPPYILYPTGSSQVLTWIGSTDITSPNFGGLALSASNYDQDNQDWLYWSTPEYLRDDPDNDQYLLFVDMIGQHFDNIWVYTKDVTNKFSADNRLDYGISKDLVADAIKDFGVKLYANNFSINDLYTAFLGITPSGSLFPYPDQTGSLPTPKGYEYIDTLISASSDVIPLDNANKRLYKRIYHNLPYLLKTKGTIAGLRALVTSYGIPDTILRINEFGGNIIGSLDDKNLKQREFNYAFNTKGQYHFSSSFAPNSNFDSGRPNTIQFRFNTGGLPTQLSQSLWSIDNGNSSLILEYTGSGLASGSYSGSIPDLYNEYGTLKFIPDSSTPSISASVYLPFFNEGWWSVMTTQNGTTASLHAANSINNTLGFASSSSVTGYSATNYNNGTIIRFPNSSSITYGSRTYLPFSGSLQEIRYYVPNLNTSSFYDYVLNPYSSEGNGINFSPNELMFRADLGTLSDISNRKSIHPKVSGSTVYITSSFASDSLFYLSSENFITNKEIISENQLISGIKDRVTDKIQIRPNILAANTSGSNTNINVLSPFRSIQQTSDVSGSFSENVNYLEVAFSPQDQINDDIIAQLGNFNLGDYIGDPRQISSSAVSYPDLDRLRDAYFEKYIHSYDVVDFIRLIKFFDNSLFRMIQDFTPARTSLSSGVVVKQHILERNRVRPAQVTSSDETLEGLVKPFSRDYNTGSGDTGQYEYISGSSIYRFNGGTGGSFEQFNGTEFYPLTLNNRFGVTQSWDELFETKLGIATYDRDDQREFYNGEFSGSAPYVKLQRGLGNEDDPCFATLTINPNEFYVYQLGFYGGPDNDYVITSASLPSPSPTRTPTPTPTVTPSTSPLVHIFTSTPYVATGSLIITSGTAPSGIFLTGTPFTMSPNNPIFPPTTSAALNFFFSTSTNTTISFTLSGTSTATAFSNLQIQDNLGTIYTGVVSGGSGVDKVVTFTLGAPSNKTFGFRGGEVNLQFP
jgi:hypothetical protein